MKRCFKQASYELIILFIDCGDNLNCGHSMDIAEGNINHNYVARSELHNNCNYHNCKNSLVIIMHGVLYHAKLDGSFILSSNSE